MKILVGIIFILVLFSCNGREPIMKDPPVISLDSIVTVTAEKVLFYGNLVLPETNSELRKRGFLISEEKDIELNGYGVKEIETNADSASVYVDKYRKYFVRMYCETSVGVYYSEEKSFKAFKKGLYFTCLGGSGEDDANQICVAHDGGYVIAGVTSSDDGDIAHNFGKKDFWFVKIDQDGMVVWSETYGGNGDDIATDVCQSSDGGYFISGSSISTDDLTQANKGGSDYRIVKTDVNGQMIWQKLFGGSADDIATSVAATDDGGCIVAGYSASSDGDISRNHGLNDCWIIRLSSNGEMVWQRMIGGSKNDEAYTVKLTSDKYFIIAGTTESDNGDITTTPQEKDGWIIKIDEGGEIMWRNTAGESFNDMFYDVISADDGGYIAVGVSYRDYNEKEQTGNSDVFVVKFASSGSVEWSSRFGSSGEDVATRVVQNKDGNYMVCGNAANKDQDVRDLYGNRDIWLIEVGESGDLRRSNNYGGTNFDTASGIVLSDRGYIVTGTTYSGDEHGAFNHRSGSADIIVLSMDNYKTFGN
ncbi:hypothetical protein ACE1ET_00735 [Saccharicrinis sp. FJH62]|uniref:hypothetical protein n=1 Tax=Saccharicrinis sp. FJH62 TaxID=3344657 RepID=UPI0035D4248F